jgi:nucleoside-diphosphate kinase
MASGPVVAMCWEGTDVVRQSRAMLGQTQPLNMDAASVRGANCVHL